MNIDEFKNELSELETLCENDTIPQSFLEEFILTNLPLWNIENNKPTEIFSRATISMLLERGTMQLESMHSGRVGFIRDGKFIDLSHYAKIYFSIFSAWQANNWLTMENPAPEKFIISLHI
ncbi:hypothetical protein [Lysobacter capsici]|uniref:hypothetical protein n=1 Tax=Lysobacter capsici TaxID=435897 RepID=UPI00287B8F64|nr:hypothetical protein [Lysobacter capsici]WND82007.1 hypothetical protein RJ610_06505 [Lysobacter capsici]WND87203.1 hypothetical protein RJ609_06510 [Lysobacter capsici]